MHLLHKLTLAAASITLAVAGFAVPASAAPAHPAAIAGGCTDHVYQTRPGSASFAVYIVNTCRFPIQAAAICVPWYQLNLFWAHGNWVYGDGKSTAVCAHATSFLETWGYETWTGNTSHYYQLGHF